MTRSDRRRQRRPRHRLDERAFHRWLREVLPAGRTGSLPLGDDAAALRPPRGQVALVSTDALVEGSHFLRSSSPRAVGRAAAAVSLSDAASKGASPAGILLDIMVPPGTPEHWLRSVVLGAEAMAAEFGAHLVGGDTKASPVRAVVSTVIAWGDPRGLAPRSGARPGDLLVVTGRVGRGGLAWKRYRSGARRIPPAVLRSLLDIHPRVREGRYLARFAHAMLDTSDGLADAAWLLSESSGVRVLLEGERIPWARGLAKSTLRQDADRLATGFYGGDYELLAAISSRAWARARKTPGTRVTLVGRVVRGEGAFLVSSAGPRLLAPAGWQPFGSRPRRGRSSPR